MVSTCFSRVINRKLKLYRDLKIFLYRDTL